MGSNFVAPNGQRGLRACMVCSIVMTQDVCRLLALLQISHDYFSHFLFFRPNSPEANSEQRFIKEGCPNCDDFLNLAGNREMITECTSQVFEGLITLAQPQKSWVAKWQRLDKYVPGVYATKVSGVLSDEVVDQMDEHRVKYIP